jgi:hypothetical protein
VVARAERAELLAGVPGRQLLERGGILATRSSARDPQMSAACAERNAALDVVAECRERIGQIRRRQRRANRIHPQPMSTPTAAGMIARSVRNHAADRGADTGVDVRHRGDALEWTNGSRAQLRSCVIADASISSVQALIGRAPSSCVIFICCSRVRGRDSCVQVPDSQGRISVVC